MAAARDVVMPGIARPRWTPLEIVFWLAPIAAYVAFPDRRLLLSQIFIYGLFALSLDLVLGYAGILSLGHAAFFGAGAYTAALLAQHGWTEPLSGLVASGAVSAAFGLVVSLLVVPGSELGRLMVTLGVGLLMFEVANHASSITGGVDGLTDLPIGALLGRIPFGLDGRAACAYGFAILLVVFLLARRLVQSPFGLALRGIRENVRRMPAIGVDVNQRLRIVFAVAAGIAGLAGAALTQTTQLCGIDSLGFQRSAELLIMLVLGGAGRLYGALIGATVFIVAQDSLAGLSPDYWQFWLGAALVALVLIARGGLLGALDALRRRVTRGKR